MDQQDKVGEKSKIKNILIAEYAAPIWNNGKKIQISKDFRTNVGHISTAVYYFYKNFILKHHQVWQ